MSNDNDGDFSFNELIENILTTHDNSDKENGNRNDHDESQDTHDAQDNHESINSDNDHETVHSHDQDRDNHDIELPDFDEADDLVAAVANAIQDIQETHADGDKEQITNDHKEISAEDNEQERQHSEWAHILQQGLLQEEDHELHDDHEPTHKQQENHDIQTSTDNIHTSHEQLDRDDENLRLAILESLQNLNEEKKETGEQQKHHTETIEIEKSKKSQSKKSSKKKKKDKPKGKEVEKSKTSPKKKKSTKHKKDKEKNKDKKNELDFHDVIEGLMEEGNNAIAKPDNNNGDNDAETQALVEETLKAFERELLGSSTEPHKHEHTKKHANDSKAKSSEKGKEKTKVSATKKQAKSESKKKKKKKSTTDKATEENYIDDDFSKVLADMVNQVVSTSLTEEPSASQSESTNKETDQHQVNIPTWNHTHFTPQHKEAPIETPTTNDEPFDLNQIMQNAMAMAFQEQNDDHFDSSVMEEFNRSLGNFNVSDLLSTSQTTTKAKTSKKKSTKKKKLDKARSFKDREIIIHHIDERKKVKIPKKPARPQKPLEQVLRKKYKSIATEAAKTARKNNRASKRAEKDKLKQHHDKQREEKKLRKNEEHKKRLTDQKELEEIVAKGPPYPIDLRLTKKGTPKKPYRRWTTEEMEKRAQMALDKPEKPVKVKKERKKKTKKLKRIPLSTLRKIPLFNFIKGNVTPQSKELNDIEGTLSKIRLPNMGLRIQSNVGSISLMNKTVIHKEKFPFHPPWIIPDQPPYVLPVARRRPRDIYRPAKNLYNTPKHNNNALYESILSNEILPKTLATVISTLKAAAKMRIANGASPEETLKYLMIIVERTKISIADAISKRNSRSVISSPVKQETVNTIDSKNDKPIRKIPIFSLAKIKTVQEKATVDEHKAHELKAIKIKKEPGNETVNALVDPEKSTQPKGVSEASNVVPDDENDTKDTKMLEFEGSSEKKSSTNQNSSGNSQGNFAADTELRVLTLRGALLGRQISPEVLSQGTKQMKKGSGSINGDEDEITTTKEVIEIKDEDEKQENKNILRSVSLNVSGVKREFPDRKSFVKVEDMVESLVNRELKRTEDDSSLSSGLSRIITSTISGILPTMKPEEEDASMIHRVRKTTLNLDGLVPPNSISRSILPLIKSDTPRKVLLKRSPEEIHSNLNKYTFNIPDFTGLPGKKSLLMKKLKTVLQAEDLVILTREMNKERKRKWREANVAKNWELDFRARLKKRANTIYGEEDSDAKFQFMNEEFQMQSKRNGYTAEDFESKKVTSKGKKISNITDEEILNIVATSIDKLDVARSLESELNDEMKKMCDPKNAERPNKRRKLNVK